MTSKGFTLIETLVALTLAATAAAIMLASVRGLFLRAEQARTHEVAVVTLLNDLTRIAHAHWRNGQLETHPDNMVLATPELPTIQVDNATIRAGQPAPPLAVAFTPFQRYSLHSQRHALSFLAPSLPSPVNTQGLSATPTVPSSSTILPP